MGIWAWVYPPLYFQTFFLFCFVQKPSQRRWLWNFGQFWPFLTSQVVCFSSCWRDPQALCQAVQPTFFRQEHPNFMLYSCMPSSIYASPAFAVYIQTNWIVDLELSSPFHSTVYWYYTLKCISFATELGNFSKHGFLSDSGFEPPPSRIEWNIPML